MLVAERQQKILVIVNEKKSVRVTELSKVFSVTEETIRRDLEKLEKEKKLERSHGGAVSVNPILTLEIPYSEREITNVKEKQNIASESVKYVEEGEKIILDASSTALYMAKQLPNIPLTVMTNSVKVTMELSNKKQVTVISTGGTLLSKSLSYVGPLAESAFNSYYFDKAFISCNGIHIERGLSESNEQQARLKARMISNVNSVYAMVDYSKFGLLTFSRISDIENVDYIITDKNTDENTLEVLKDRGIGIIKL